MSMSTGGRKRSNSSSAPAAKAAKSKNVAVTKKAARKAKYKQQYSNKVRLSVNNILGTLGPDRLRAKLKYVQTQQNIDYTVGVPAQRAYNLNSVYDPDATGVGHQPRGLDQIYAMGYSQYMVTAVAYRVVVEQHQNDNVLTGGWDLVSVINNNSFSAQNHELTLEQCLQWCRIYSTTAAAANTLDIPTGASVIQMGKFLRLKDVYGRKLDEGSDAGTITSSVAGTNPASTAQLVLTCFAHTATNITFKRYYSIFLKYYVEFFRANQLATVV